MSAVSFLDQKSSKSRMGAYALCFKHFLLISHQDASKLDENVKDVLMTLTFAKHCF